LSDGTYRDLWLDEVFRTPLLSAEVQVFLLLLGRHMDENGFVSERAADLARAISCTERRIASKFATAIASHFLERVARGQKGQTAVYRALVPVLQGDGRRHPEGSAQGDASRQAETAQGDSRRHPERKVQGASRRHPERVKAPIQGDGRRQAETAPLYKDHARAHSRDHLSLQAQQPEDADQTPGGVVIALFEEQISTGKKLTSAKRAQVEPRPPVAREDFDKFWATYPRRIAKGAARKAWDKALKNGADPEEIIWGARAYASLPRDPADGLKYVAHPATWLNGERWTDEADPEPEARPSTTTSRVAQVDDALAEFHRLTGTHAADARPHTIKGELLR
jgi:hypothetical protein